MPFTGFTPVLIATVISGVSGYIAVWITAQNLVPAMYRDFSVLWSTIFFSVGALSGIQQELSRSTTQTHLNSSETKKTVKFFSFAVGLTILIFVISALVSVFDGYAVVAEGDQTINFAITLGLASFVFLSVLIGALYGHQQWNTIAVLVAGEGITRLCFVFLALFIPGLIGFLPWAICLPFGVIVLLSAPMWIKKVKSGIALDVNYPKFTHNLFSTIGAAAATAVIISGFPLLLRVTSRTNELELLAPVLLIIMLVRAPLAVLAQSMQNLLVVKFSSTFSAAIRLFGILAGLIVGFALITAIIGYFFGPTVINLFFAESYELSGMLLAIVVLSSGFLAIQIVSGSFVLARNKHFGYILGWLVSAAVTIVVLLLPLEFELRVVLSLCIGPISGIASNAISLAFSKHYRQSKYSQLLD